MNVTYSTTLPNIFDTVAIATAKLLQLVKGTEKLTADTGTIQINPLGDEIADTRWLTMEKILAANASVVPPVGQKLLFDGAGNPITDGSGANITVPI